MGRAAFLLNTVRVTRSASESNVEMVVMATFMANQADSRIFSPRILEHGFELGSGAQALSRVVVELFLNVVVQENILKASGAFPELKRRDEFPIGRQMELLWPSEISWIVSGCFVVVESNVCVATILMRFVSTQMSPIL